MPEAIAARAKPTVVVVKTRETIGRQTFEQLASRAETLAAADRAAEEARAVPARVERWFGEANFHHAEFADLRRLVQLKEKQGLTVSLVLPTLDEEETIGPIVRRAIREMMGRVPLVDEILVIDSQSTDRTREIAEAEGARVVQHPDVLARYGSFRGKGEALWKSVYETSGDIIVWADTDVRNWHPRMVYGTLGPLLHEPRLQYVKGYYQRPIVAEGVLKEGGGGRVTELVARPLINLFYPELSGMIQPLAGEYAGRRSLLETIPFFTGYAVEIGHLIDAAERVGIEGLGQVDLERRVHRNQELEGLSRMSFVILQAVMKRLEERRKARLFAELGSTMKLPRSGRGQLSLEVIELADQERPPMIRIPEYLERRRALGLAETGRRRRRTRARAGRALSAVARGRAAHGPLRARFVQGLADRRSRSRAALAAGWARARPDDELLSRPLADGGEGTLVAIEAAGGWTWRDAHAHDPARTAGQCSLAAVGRRPDGGRRAGRGVGAVASCRPGARSDRGDDARHRRGPPGRGGRRRRSRSPRDRRVSATTDGGPGSCWRRGPFGERRDRPERLDTLGRRRLGSPATSRTRCSGRPAQRRPTARRRARRPNRSCELDAR